ncbi:MAG: DHHA1 domain-containing protein, partial [Arenicellales bacterium]
EVLTGQAALNQAHEELDALQTAMRVLNTEPEGLAEKLDALIKQNKALTKKLQTAQSQLAMSGAMAGSAQGSDQSQAIEDINGVKFMLLRIDGMDIGTLRSTVDQARDKIGEGVVVVGGVNEGKVTIIVAVSKGLTKQFQAGKIIQHIMPLVGGRGGGKPDMAQGGGSDPEGLGKALLEVKALMSA